MSDAYSMQDVAIGLDPSTVDPKPPPKRVSTAEEADALAPGAEFVDPEGQVRTKPYRPQSLADLEDVPEGAEFLDPAGGLRTKPRYQGISFTAQTLYDMALTEKEREKILERSYPGKVRREPTGEFYVDDEGTRRKPGRGAQAVPAFVAAAAAPTALGALGALGAGAAAAPTGPGAFFAAAGGGFTGSVLGQSFNDLVLQLAGVYDRTPMEEFGNLGTAGLMGTAGAGVGRGIATVVPSAKAGASALGAALPRVARSALGIDPEKLRTAVSLSDKGVLVPPSTHMKEAPHLANISEVFDPAFRTQEPFLQSATEYYERTAKGILESPEIGADVRGSLVQPTEAVSTERAGLAAKQRALYHSNRADARLRAMIEAEISDRPKAIAAEHASRVEQLRVAERESRERAQALIDQGFRDIQTDVDRAMGAAEAGHNSGDLWWAVGEKLQKLRQGIQERARKMYDEADRLAGDHRPNIEGLPERAQEFLDQLPPGFESKYPSVVQGLKSLAGEMGENGQWVREPVQPTFGQLHNLRSVFRSHVNYHDLTPDLRDGTYKFFARRVDEILHDAGAVPELKSAAVALDGADKFYGEAIRPLTERSVQAVVNGLESGLPADPKILFDTLVREGRSDLTAKVRDMVGPNLWSGVKAADVQAMLDNSRTLVPGQIDGRAFARQVLDRHRSNMLEAVHGKETSAKLLRQAQDVAMLDGRLDVGVRPTDTLTSVIAKTRDVSAALKEAAKQDPLALLRKEMRGIEREQKQRLASARRERQAEPLGFLYDPTVGATEAVERILRSEDLILASAARFGEQSPEFRMLRQVWAQRVLENTLEPGKRLTKMSPEVQRIMFPGATLEDMRTLAREMEFLTESKALRMGDRGAGLSMSAVSKVEHPWSHILGRGGAVSQFLTAPTKVIPGADFAGRAILTKYYALITKLATSPATLRWLAKGLDGTPEEKAAVRAALSKVLQRGGAVGAGGGEAAYQYGASP